MSRTTETGIMQSWRSRTCLVSIVCPTYNHEEHIEQALEGFLAQRTDFAFEIIVHDDASSDSTAAIVRAYAEKFPSIIRPILQSENQYSKGGFKPAVYAAEYAVGEYIAICEGDDYWIDSSKLQRQVDLMEAHPDVDFCFHAAYILNDDEMSMEQSWSYGTAGLLDLDKLLNARLGSFAPTASYLLRKRVFERLPFWFRRDAPVGDFFIERYGSLSGGALYLPEPMSVYRNLSSGSWTVSVRDNKTVNHKYIDGMCKSLPLMALDFEEYAADFRRFCARFYLKYAQEALFAGDEERFRRLLRLSVEECSYVSRKQRVAHYFRAFPDIVKRLINMQRRYKK